MVRNGLPQDAPPKKEDRSGRLVTLDTELQRMIDARHGVIHRLQIDRGLRKHDISELLGTAMAVVDAFVDHLESERSMHIRDRA